ncbi:MAG: hypothetical protein FWG65_12175 [Turicibacter sp.]|nr:hypothetical protein [Turicibacter sp.]
MINLENFEFKDVKIVDIDGDIFVGRVKYYTHELDDPDGLANIALVPYNLSDWEDGVLLSLYEHEIASIEILETAETAVENRQLQLA